MLLLLRRSRGDVCVWRRGWPCQHVPDRFSSRLRVDLHRRDGNGKQSESGRQR